MITKLGEYLCKSANMGGQQQGSQGGMSTAGAMGLGAAIGVGLSPLSMSANKTINWGRTAKFMGARGVLGAAMAGIGNMLLSKKPSSSAPTPPGKGMLYK